MHPERGERELLTANKNIPSQPFVSPFSYRQGYNLTWFKVDARWKGIENALGEVTERVKNIATLTNTTKVISKYQLIRHFFSDQSKPSIIKYLGKLNRSGLLLKHSMVNNGKELVIYTLGPLGARVVKEPYSPNWWCKLQAATVIKQLVANQLYLRLARTGEAKYNIAPYPFTGVLSYKGYEFPLIVVRGDVEDINREIRYAEFNRGIVICEDTLQIEQVASNIIQPVRYTTDYDILYNPLNSSFYSWTPEKGVEKENLTLFPNEI